MSTIEFDVSEIEFSRPDKLRKITLPTSMNGHLAEDIGIHVGDGSMNIYKYTNRGNFWLRYTGNRIEEKDYYEYIQSLLKGIYNFSGTLIPSMKDKSFNLVIRSKAIVLFKSKILKLPLGTKNSIAVPEIIIKFPKFWKEFLIGLIDTDFSLTFKKRSREEHYYPVMHLGCNSKPLVEQVNEILKKFDINSDTQFNEERYDKRTGKTYVTHSLYINGKKNFNKYAGVIGFNNPVHITKYEIWKTFGFCPPRTTLEQRLKILNGELSLDDLASVAQLAEQSLRKR